MIEALLRRLMSRRGSDRGAVVPMVAILLPTLVLIASFAVDIGQQRVGRSDMQALSDVVSLDLVHLVDGRTAAQITADPLWASTKAQSVARNFGTYGSPPVVNVELGTVPNLSDSTMANFKVFTPMSNTSTATPTAVRVTSNTNVSFTIRPGVGPASRSAVAVAQPQQCFQLGSYAAALNAGNSSLLNQLLGSHVPGLGITAAGYQGLGNVNVALGDVAAQLGLAGTNQLAGATVSLKSFYLAIAQVLTNNGDAADAQLVQALATQVASSGSVNLGTLLSASGTGGLNVATNVLDLIAGSAMLVNGTNAVSIPGLSTSIPGLGNITSSLNVVQGKVEACGPVSPNTKASTSQVAATVTGTVAATNVVVPGLGTVTVGTPSGQLSNTTVSLASAVGTLTGARCPNAVDSSVSETITVVNGLLNVSTSVPLAISGQLNVAGVGLVNVTISLTATVSKTSQPAISNVTITVPPQKYGTAYPSAAGTFALSASDITTTTTSVTATLVGGLVNLGLSAANQNSIIQAVDQTVLAPIISQLNAGLLAPLSSLVGLEVAGADVYDRQTAPCTGGALAG